MWYLYFQKIKYTFWPKNISTTIVYREKSNNKKRTEMSKPAKQGVLAASAQGMTHASSYALSNN